MILDPPHLFLAAEVLQDLQDVSPAVTFLRLEALSKIHINIILDRRSRIRQQKINLSGVPLVDDGEG